MDFYKEYKNSYGLKIDSLLDDIKKMIKSKVRRIDVVFQGKSEESMFLLLPMTDLKGAVVLAERVQDALGNIKKEIEEVSLSISICEISNLSEVDIIMGTLEQNKKMAIENGGNEIKVEKI